MHSGTHNLCRKAGCAGSHDPGRRIQDLSHWRAGIDHYNGAEITSSTKFWPDSNQDGIINGNDYYHQATSQTDGAGWIYENDKIVKAWWAESNNVAKAIYEDHTLFEQYQIDKQAGYVDAVYVPKITIIMLEQSLWGKTNYDEVNAINKHRL